ncbi:DgyrCDS8768 [Dimorphilus gyrociliatus]|uniref:DgyrCDS8768 n=1 Tax=Dimorphilus gyrociliatus TaxID=2664684 RepID=A0A7I8W0A5_9ANNE|nr:DgyrCDS8768 [Dimorphilus gyrociliatus]
MDVQSQLRMKRNKKYSKFDAASRCSENDYKYFDKSTRTCVYCLRCPVGFNDKVCPGTSYNCFELRRSKGGFTPNCTLLYGMDCNGVAFIGSKCNQTCRNGTVNEYTCKDSDVRNGKPVWIPSGNVVPCNSSEVVSEEVISNGGATNLIGYSFLLIAFLGLLILFTIWIVKKIYRRNKEHDPGEIQLQPMMERPEAQEQLEAQERPESQEHQGAHKMSVIVNTASMQRHNNQNDTFSENDENLERQNIEFDYYN